MHSDETPTDLRAVVLAGGHSRRFGEPNKALAQAHGRSVVSRVTAAVRSVGDAPSLIAVQSERQQARLDAAIDQPVEYVRDAPDLTGPLAGLVAAARTAQTDRLAVVGCDMPLLVGGVLRWLARQSSTADAVLPVDSEGKGQPVHAIYRTDAITGCESSVGSMRAFVDDLDVYPVPVETTPASVPLSRSLTNVNTQADLTAVRRRWQRLDCDRSRLGSGTVGTDTRSEG
ncbi:molybdenum cofactor guanylyltransferase [Halorientalis salina]|uniref:molybdenum cofactor guanylyltransferase n=1 Tax=Halorientalis salina TaxID=2932266 RepID=UPI00145CA84E|nr:molybdenum cofactor guanylyltransferase [Halorientalis salina]